MIIPDCTVVTMFFDLTRFYEHSRDVKTAFACAKGLLNTSCYLVIFADSVMMPMIRNERKQFDNITYYVLMEVEDLPKYNKTQRVRENREKYHPTKDTRTCPENHIMQCSKVDLLLKAMDMDIFRTHMFAWVDGCTGENFYKIGRPGTSRMLLQAINRKDPSKFYLQVLNVTDKRFKDPKQKREYYAQYQWVVCGCFMVMGKEIGQKICHRVNEIFEETLNAGYGHGDEMLFLEILDEFYDHIVKSYGDYHHILPNFYSTQEGFHYIFYHIIKKYNNFGYYREAYDCCERIIQDIENNPALPEDYESWWMQMLFQQYLAAYYYKPESAYGIVSKIRDLCHIRPKFRQEYERTAGLYDSQLPYIDYLKPKYDLIFCIFGCIGVEKYRKEIECILQTWGKTVEDVKEKKVLILFFLKPSGDMSLFQNSKYIHFIYLDNIFDDYLSAADKQYKGLKYIYEHYHASWIYVCGTDTFVHVQRLLDKLDKYDPEKPYFIGGNDNVREVSSHTILFHSGGPGFVFSHVVLKQIYPQLMTFQISWSKLCREAKCEDLISACDVSFAFLIQSFSIFETLSSCFFNSNFRGNAYNNSWKLNEPLSIYSPNMLACHHMTPHDFSELYSLLFV